MLTTTFRRKQATFLCVTVCAALLIVYLTVKSKGNKNDKLAAMDSRVHTPKATVDGDHLLSTVVSADKRSTVYTFVNGSIRVTDIQRTEETCAKISRTGLQDQFKRQLQVTSAACNVSRIYNDHSLCMVGPFKPRQPCYALSFSAHGTWDFESELANSGCQVLALDPSMRQPSHMRSERLLVLSEGLGDAAAGLPSLPEKSIAGYLKHFQADKVAIDVLKVDLRSNNWPTLQAAVNDGSLMRVKQLMLTVRLDRGNVSTADQLRCRIVTLRNLEEHGFRRWYPSVAKLGQQSEVILSFVNINYLKKGSLSKKARNPPGSKLALPLETLAISKGPGYTHLEAVRRANLSAMSPAQLDRMYFNLVEQQHLICPHSRRIGDADDGGWDVCFSGPFDIAKSAACIAFSFGINNVWRYDDVLADVYHCRVLMFDPSMTTVSDHQRRNTSWFYRIGLSSNNTVQRNGWKMRTLCRLLDEFGHSNGTIDILKIDIDYWEWVVFEQALKDGCLRRVKQLMFETHTAGLFRKQSSYATFIRILSGIFDVGFRTWKWHKNPKSIFVKSDSGLHRACCYEHYMLNSNYVRVVSN